MDFLQAWGLALFPRRTSSIPGLICMSVTWVRPLYSGASYLVDIFTWVPHSGHLSPGVPSSMNGTTLPPVVQVSNLEVNLPHLHILSRSFVS